MNSTIISVIEQNDSRWKTICVGDEEYFISAIDNDGSWRISLTNLIEIWMEELDSPAISKKCEELNPSLSIEDIDIQGFIRQLLVDIPKHTTKVSVEKIELCTEFQGGIFFFAINFTKGTAQQFWEIVTMPMCLAIGELQRRHAILLELVKAKDEEISEYKLNDAKLVRKCIETKPFCNDLFKQNMPAQNVANCRTVFQRIMVLRGESKLDKFIMQKEHTETCSSEPTAINEAKIKIEAEESPRLENTDQVMDTEASPRLEGNLTSTIQESDSIVPKVKTNSSLKFTKASKSTIGIAKKTSDIPKRAQSARSSPSKRPKKTIHDFIK